MAKNTDPRTSQESSEWPDSGPSSAPRHSGQPASQKVDLGEFRTRLTPEMLEALAVEADRVWGVKDVVARMPVSEKIVRRMIGEGRIPSQKIDGRIFVFRKAFVRASGQGFPLPKGRLRQKRGGMR